jgi:hypothetical protein
MVQCGLEKLRFSWSWNRDLEVQEETVASTLKVGDTGRKFL